MPSRGKDVSLVHASFEWRKDRLWCKDAGSTNAWCLGLDAVPEIDRAAGLVQKDGPLLITGLRNSDQEWLARRIHEASPRREQPFTSFTSRLPRNAETLLDEARFGTVFIDLSAVGKVTKAFASKLFDGDPPFLALRPIIASPSHAESQRAFQQLGQGHTLELPPLATRRLAPQMGHAHLTASAASTRPSRSKRESQRGRWPMRSGTSRSRPLSRATPSRKRSGELGRRPRSGY